MKAVEGLVKPHSHTPSPASANPPTSGFGSRWRERDMERGRDRERKGERMGEREREQPPSWLSRETSEFIQAVVQLSTLLVSDLCQSRTQRIQNWLFLLPLNSSGFQTQPRHVALHADFTCCCATLNKMQLYFSTFPLEIRT